MRQLTHVGPRSRAVQPGGAASRHRQVPSGICYRRFRHIRNGDGHHGRGAAAVAVFRSHRLHMRRLGLVVVGGARPGSELPRVGVDGERALVRPFQTVDESVFVGVRCRDGGADVHNGRRVLLDLADHARSFPEHRRLVRLGPRLQRLRPVAGPLGIPGSHLHLVRGALGQSGDRSFGSRPNPFPAALEGTAPGDSVPPVVVPDARPGVGRRRPAHRQSKPRRCSRRWRVRR